MAVVYIHKGLDNGEVFYVGIGKPHRPFDKKGRNRYWYEYVRAHGYIVEITHRDLILEEASSIEKYLISFYGRSDLGKGNLVNLTDGGYYFSNLSKESREKIAESKLGKPNPWLAEINRSRKGIPAPHRSGKNHPMYGKNQSEEAKLKISKASKGRFSGEAHPMYGIRGEDHHFFGKKHTEETKKRMSESKTGLYSGSSNPRAKKIIDEGGNVVYGSGKDLSDALSVPFSTVRSWLNGRNKSPEWFNYKYAA